MGFATHLDSDRSATFASVDFSRFKNVPQALMKPQSRIKQLERQYGKKAVQAALMQARSELAPKKLTAEQKALIKAMEEEQKIRFDCPGCGQGLRAKPESLGKEVRCPKCGETITVTQQPEAKAPKCLADLVRLGSKSQAVKAPKASHNITATMPRGPSGSAPKSMADLVRFK